MHQAQKTIEIVSRNGAGLYNITREITAWTRTCDITTGLLTLFLRHTSASLVIQENADPDVLEDLNDFFERLVPQNPSLYRHTMEGADDMPAHIRTVLTQTQINVPIVNSRPALGTWQGVYLYEHRRRPHTRQVVLHLIGE